MFEYVKYFWDILACVLIIASVISCYRKGFMYSFVKTAGSIASVIASAIFSEPVARNIYDTLFKKKMVSGFEKLFSSFGEIDMAEFTSLVTEKLSGLPGQMGSQMQLSFDEYAERWFQSFNRADFYSYAETFTNAVAEPVVVALLKCICFLLIFLVLSFLVKLIANLFKGIKYIPVLGSLNAILGSLLGIVQGVIHVIVLCGILWVIISFFGGIDNIITPSIIEETYILRTVFNTVPFLSGILT